MSKSGYVAHLEGRYIDVLKRTKEYFKAPGVFRITKGRWVIGITRDNP